MKNKCEYYNASKRLETYIPKLWVTHIFFKLEITVNPERRVHSPLMYSLILNYIILKHITESLPVVMDKIPSWEAAVHPSICEQGNIFTLSPTTHIILFNWKAIELSTYSHCIFPKFNTADIQRERLIACELETGMGNTYITVPKEPCARGRHLVLWCCQVRFGDSTGLKQFSGCRLRSWHLLVCLEP